LLLSSFAAARNLHRDEIQTCPIPELPRRLWMPEGGAASTVSAAATQAPLVVIKPIHPLAKLPLGGSAFRLASPAPNGSESDNAKIVECLRVVTNVIAEHCGRTTKLANGVIWLSVDSKNLYDHCHDPATAKSERVVEALEVTSSFLTVLAGVRGLERCEVWSTPVHFVAKFGDSVHQGQFTMSPSELAALSPEQNAATYSELLKLPEIFTPAS